MQCTTAPETPASWMARTRPGKPAPEPMSTHRVAAGTRPRIWALSATWRVQTEANVVSEMRFVDFRQRARRSTRTVKRSSVSRETGTRCMAETRSFERRSARSPCHSDLCMACSELPSAACGRRRRDAPGEGRRRKAGCFKRAYRIALYVVRLFDRAPARPSTGRASPGQAPPLAGEGQGSPCMGGDERQRGRRDAFNSARLTEAAWTDRDELLPKFHGEAGDVGIVEVARKRQ